MAPRYARAFILLAGIAFVPTFIHSYLGITANDGRSTQNIGRSLGLFESEPTDKTNEWVETRFKSRDWIERRYRETGEAPLLLFVSRSFDPKRLYHHPELALIYGSDFGEEEILRLSADPTRTIHFLRGRRNDEEQEVAYALLYDGRFVDDPILFQLKEAWRSLFRARRPMTLFFVSDSRPSSHLPLEEGRALRLLNRSIDSFLSQGPVETK